MDTYQFFGDAKTQSLFQSHQNVPTGRFPLGLIAGQWEDVFKEAFNVDLEIQNNKCISFRQLRYLFWWFHARSLCPI